MEIRRTSVRDAIKRKSGGTVGVQGGREGRRERERVCAFMGEKGEYYFSAYTNGKVHLGGGTDEGERMKVRG
ncbi:MAG: hypothetical protein MJE68_32815, partial [Proteobacteria bacterium]|nr:hypothetical protein [Pseudomonadota bacterium]